MVQVSSQYHYWFKILWEFSFIKGWQKSGNQNYPSGFWAIFGDWGGKLEISNVAQMSLMKCYWMLQRVTAFTVTELVKETLHGEEGGGYNYLSQKNLKEFRIFWLRILYTIGYHHLDKTLCYGKKTETQT